VSLGEESAPRLESNRGKGSPTPSDHSVSALRSRTDLSRISRNSFGPFRSRRFRCCRSSSGTNGSISFSICLLAKSRAFDLAFWLRGLGGCIPVSASPTKRLMASVRLGASFCRRRHPSIFSRTEAWHRMPMRNPVPVVTGRPRRGLLVIDLIMNYVSKNVAQWQSCTISAIEAPRPAAVTTGRDLPPAPRPEVPMTDFPYHESRAALALGYHSQRG
jgi:hypothetical protein